MAQREQSEAGAGGWFSLHQSCLGPVGFLPGDASQDASRSFWECEGSFGIPTVFSFSQRHLAGQVTSLPFLQVPLSLLPSRGDTGAGLGRQRRILYRGA